MITAIAIDDEPLALKVIEKFCLQSGQVNLLKTFTHTGEATLFFEQNNADLLFLDINMPSISGIDFYKNMKQQPLLIFTTAYSDYAVEGFNLNAVDYLLKPFTFKRFAQAIEKVTQLKTQRATEINADPFITIRADYSLIKILLRDILFIESLDNYVKIHLEKQKPVLARMPMKTIIELLPGSFIRIHRSYIVSFERIESIRNKVVYLKDDELPVGNNYEKELMERFIKGNV
jgi:DNA-binding LytR/AlgR family response regulator